MNMGQRGGAAAASRRTRHAGIPPVYEDFKPTSEWKHEEGAATLFYQLPGFAKEQIKIVADSRGILRVRGERLVTSNRWSRFQEEVVIPQDCRMSEIRAKFEAGILRILMPKKMVISDKKNPVDEQPNTTSYEPPTPSVTRPNIQPEPQPKLNDVLPSKPTLPTIAENPQFGTFTSPPTFIPREGEDKSIHKKQHEAAMSPLKPPIDNTSQHVPDYSLADATKVHKTPEYFASSVDSKRGEGEGTSQSSCSGMKENELYDDALDHDKAGMEEMNENKRFGDQKRVTKSHISRNFNEDGQLLINMGAAVLVIVAIGSYVFYSFNLGD